MIEVLNSGGEIRMVDSGRFGYRQYGVPTSGAMDLTSALKAQNLVQNDSRSPLLEIYLPGHSFQFHKKCTISLTGAKADCTINNRSVEINTVHSIKPKDILTIGKMYLGCRIYMGLNGSFTIDKLLQSYSPIPGYWNQAFHKGDFIHFSSKKNRVQLQSSVAALLIDERTPIRCYPGPEWKLLQESQKTQLLEQTWMISQHSNRMGYRLEGESVKMNEPISIYSSSVMPGTVQLLPSGLPIVLMRDCQTTGGYPRIFQICESAINQIAQRRPGKEIRFQLIEDH